MNTYKTVLGMDKLPSYNGFSVMVINESGILLRKDVLSMEEVSEIALSSKADAIAIDNIYEIGSESEIRRFTTLLYSTNLIQVTGSPSEGFKPLSVIGKQLGITGGEKLSPSKSAEVCAKAALAGYGFLVKIYDPETRITISRRRKFGSGGMSEGRYRRSIQGSVLNLTKMIESALDSKGIDYDHALRKGSHGIEGSSFIVYAPRNLLFGIVRPIRTSSVNVRVTPTFTKSFEFVPLWSTDKAPPKRYLIIGVDPGMVCGLAVIDLSGRILHLTSGRGITRGQITRLLATIGRALVFATDVNPPPSLLVKLSASHSAILFSPDRSLKTFEKTDLVEKIVGNQGIKVQNSHQRDALAAAAKAYSFYRNKLEQAVSHARAEERPVHMEEVKANVLRGKSIKDAIALSRTPVIEEVVPKRRAGSEREQIKVLETKFEDMQAERDRLLQQIKVLEEKIEDLELSVRLTKLGERPERPHSAEIYELERRIRSLLNEIGQLRSQLEFTKSENIRLCSEMGSLASGKSLLFKRYSTVTEVLRDLANLHERKIALVERIGKLSDELLKALRTSSISAIVVEEILPEEKTQISEAGIPVVLLSSINSKNYGAVQTVEKVTFEKALEEAKKELKDFSEVKTRKVRDLLEEYRKERLKENLSRG
jgi:predicted RNase H-like nuclease (RuvC/YqgF family)